MASTFGNRFRITTFGESHGKSVGVVLDGVPAGLKISLEEIQTQLNRRRPGQSKITSPRSEADSVSIHSGIENGFALGAPIMLLVENRDQRPNEYSETSDIFRPSHADFTTLSRFGIKASSGGGRSSARETIGRVAGGAIAEQYLRRVCPSFEIVAWVHSVYDQIANNILESSVTREEVDANIVRCPDQIAANKMIECIEQAKLDGDSLGGVIRCIIRGIPAGLGEPVFDKLEADLAKAMLSLPATKGFEIGSGFSGTRMKGSEHNDPFTKLPSGRIGTSSNRSGGIQGGISNGEIISFSVAFKPVATIGKPQKSVDISGNSKDLPPSLGRHDPCVLPRAVPMVEAMGALVIADHWLRTLDAKI